MANEGDGVIEPVIKTEHFGAYAPLTSVLYALAAQEGADGDEGNAMQAAADFIRSMVGSSNKKVVFVLPMPPSVNAAYANGGNKRGRHKTKRAIAWTGTAGAQMNAQCVPEMPPPYRIDYAFGRPDRRRRDAFNYEKLLSDFLKDQFVITDDCEIEIGTVRWADDVAPGTVRITVESLG